MQFIFVELDKFDKTAELYQTDLDKLIYTILSKHSDWSDDAIADLLEVSVDVVAEERQSLYKKTQ